MHWVHHRLLIELYDVDDQGVTDSHVGTSSSSTTTKLSRIWKTGTPQKAQEPHFRCVCTSSVVQVMCTARLVQEINTETSHVYAQLRRVGSQSGPVCLHIDC